MTIDFITADELRKILNEELDKRFGPAHRKADAHTHVSDDELIGTTEACHILGCSTRTLQRYRDQRLFSVRMLGPKKALYFHSEVLAFRAANTRPSRDSK